MSDSDSDSDVEPTIADRAVVTKYETTAKVANSVMRMLISKCVDGAQTLTLCKLGDGMIVQETSNIYKKRKEMAKGIGFPTCISVNNCICHYSPLESEKDVISMKKGDVVKIDLGVQIDGFIVAIAHTLVVGCSADEPITDRRADVINAAYLCSEAALRLVKPENKANQVTDMVNRISSSFDCKPIQGMLSHQLLHNRIDGDKTIIQNPNEKQKQDHDNAEFACHEVYAVDCLVSTGVGVPKDFDTRTTIYKRNPDIVYQLRMKTSRGVFSEIEKKYDTMCFNLRSLQDEKKARLGIVECYKHDLCSPFPVLWEKQGEFVAQFKFTVLLMPDMPHRITENFFDQACYKSEHSITETDIKELLETCADREAAQMQKQKEMEAAQSSLAEAIQEAV